MAPNRCSNPRSMRRIPAQARHPRVPLPHTTGNNSVRSLAAAYGAPAAFGRPPFFGPPSSTFHSAQRSCPAARTRRHTECASRHRSSQHSAEGKLIATRISGAVSGPCQCCLGASIQPRARRRQGRGTTAYTGTPASSKSAARSRSNLRHRQPRPICPGMMPSAPEAARCQTLHNPAAKERWGA